MVDEMSSIAKFILELLSECDVYYNELPEGRRLPCVYFPPAEVESYSGGLGTYRRHYSWFIHFFAGSDKEPWLGTRKAVEMAMTAQHEIIKRHNMLPLICDDGSVEGHLLYIQQPDVKKLDTGAAWLYLQWDSIRLYEEAGDTVQRFEYNIKSK